MAELTPLDEKLGEVLGLAQAAQDTTRKVLQMEGADDFKADLERISLINFWAPWAEPCKQMNDVVLELAKKYPALLVLQVRARCARYLQCLTRRVGAS